MSLISFLSKMQVFIISLANTWSSSLTYLCSFLSGYSILKLAKTLSSLSKPIFDSIFTELEDPEKECADYDKHIEEHGGIDLQLLGIGRNGHIAFNEPDTDLVSGTHVTALTDDTIDANARFFDDIKDVPTKSLTMGMASIMKSKNNQIKLA